MYKNKIPKSCKFPRYNFPRSDSVFTLIDNVEALDIVMPMYNCIEYSKNYRKTTGSLWNYYRDEPKSGLGGDDNNINYSIKDSKSFNYKTSITGKLENDNEEKKSISFNIF